VNGQGQHICTPEDIEIHTMPSANGISLCILSVEASMSSAKGVLGLKKKT